MKATSFNTGWTCRHLGSSAPGTPVTLPHDAMLAEERSQASAGGTNTGCLRGTIICMKSTSPPMPRRRRSAQCWNLRAFTITPKYT